MSKTNYDFFPGQIVTCWHTDEMGRKGRVCHPFLVIDSAGFNSEKTTNLYCLRITSNIEDMENKVLIEPDEFNHLKMTSAVCIDSNFVFKKSNCEIIGQLHWSTFNDVIIKRSALQTEQMNHCLYALKHIMAYQEKLKK